MRRLIPVVLGLAVLLAIVVMRDGTSDRYRLIMQLANAGGLRDGSPVVIGGVPVGTVKLHANREDVTATLEIERRYGPVGRDVVAGIIAQNVVGQKQVRLQIGDRRRPAPNGMRIPAKQILETTDLDQLLNTFDPDTRSRLAVLINETAAGFTGRKESFRSLTRDLAPALNRGSQVLARLSSDGAALDRTLDLSDRFIDELATNRRSVARVIDRAGALAESVQDKRAQLRATLASAPGALRTARRFLTELERTTPPLGETARLLTRTMPSFSDALERVVPFQRDVSPTIKALEPLGPIAARTGKLTSKPVERLIATTSSALDLSRNEIAKAGPVLDKSVDNLLATVDNWAHAVGQRDGLSHIFRGEVGLSPDYLDTIIQRLSPVETPTTKRRTTERPTAKAPSGPPAATPVTGPAAEAPQAAKPTPPVQTITDTLNKILGGTPVPADGQAPKTDPTAALLDYLLGK